VRINLSLAFSRTVRKAPDTPEMKCFPSQETLSPVNLIPGSKAVKKKRELFPGCLPMSASSFMLPYHIHVPVQEY
jgi:hypothetical protein